MIEAPISSSIKVEETSTQALQREDPFLSP